MSDLLPCGLESPAACAASGPLTLAEARAGLERQAARGVCDTGRYRCRYYAWGAGPPLVFVPGLCDDALSFLMPAALLSRHFRCIAYDLPDGRDDGARLARYRHEDHVADLFALLDHLEVGRSYVFGSSFGTTVALAALRAAPGRLPRAVLQGGFARRPLAPAEYVLAQLARHAPGSMGRLPFRGALLRRAQFAAFRGRDPAAWRFLLDRWNAPPLAAVARRALVLHRLDLRPVLPDIRQPVLLVCGDGDPPASRRCEEELLRGLPHAARVELEGCGRVPHFSHPELLAEVVRRFLTPPGGNACG